MKIELNKQLDKEVYLDFHELSVGGVNFGKKISDSHPIVTKDNYDKYIDDYYIAHAKELADILGETIKCFDDVKDVLFTELEKYFGRDYSKKDYTCYLSIFDCNPRYIETMSFQVYYRRPFNLRKEVIVHELTHFAFYDFCHGIGIKDSKELWELSEIFNILFLNMPSIQDAVGAKELLFYPDLKDKLERVEKVWEKQLGAEDFILASLRAIQ
ncbi:MAG: hypothetical protein WCP09_01405 [Candidatus Taylorbacteria bacterium]